MWQVIGDTWHLTGGTYMWNFLIFVSVILSTHPERLSVSVCNFFYNQSRVLMSPKKRFRYKMLGLWVLIIWMLMCECWLSCKPEFQGLHFRESSPVPGVGHLIRRVRHFPCCMASWVCSAFLAVCSLSSVQFVVCNNSVQCVMYGMQCAVRWIEYSTDNTALSAVCISAVQCSAVQCSTEQCSVVQLIPIQCTQYSAVQCSAVQCSAVQCSAVRIMHASVRLRSREPLRLVLERPCQ